LHPIIKAILKSGMKKAGPMALNLALACLTKRPEISINNMQHHLLQSKSITSKLGLFLHMAAGLRSVRNSTVSLLVDNYWTIFNLMEPDPGSTKYKRDLKQIKIKGQLAIPGWDTKVGAKSSTKPACSFDINSSSHHCGQ
jgi:hypothetical protein